MRAEAVAAVLAHIGLGAGSAAPLWVADDGRFGAGPLRGRHGKDAAEHVGAGARAEARQRRLDELRAQLRAAGTRHTAEDATHRALREHRRQLRELRDHIPPTAEVDDAAAAAAGATRDAQRATEHHDELRRAAAVAFRAAEEQWARAQTVAADAGLPLDAAELHTISAAIADAAAVLRDLPGLLGTARRSLGDWHAAVDDWNTEIGAHAGAAAGARESTAQAEHAATELATVEASLGEEPERIAEQVAEAQQALTGLDEDVRATQSRHTDAGKAAATARAQADGAEREAATAEVACRDARSDLLATCEVPGLLPAARDPDEAQSDEAQPDELPATPDTTDGAARLFAALRSVVPPPERDVGEDALDRSLRAIRDSLGAGWDAEARRAADGAPVAVEVSGPYGRRALLDAAAQVITDLRRARNLLSAKQDQALRNLLHGRVAREVATALFEARELVDRCNAILGDVTTSLGIGVKLDWRTRGDLDGATATALRLLGKDPDARTEDEDAAVRTAVAGLVDEARAADPESSYRTVIGEVLDYRRWHELRLYLRRPGRNDELLSRRTRLSEGEKKLVTYLPMAAAAAASAAAHDPHGVGAPRLVLLDDAFAKVSEDNHARLFGLLVSLDLDFIVTSERLWGTHATVPELAITEVLRDPDLRAIALVHSRWDGRQHTGVAA
ncbi:MAG: hypothetical protein GEV09_20870 [Pseudonocardiaceae bacterium]|nr:hypothetical protein [Pseudonocardiaceae bacterium]